ncbi:Vacuolar protein-sorting-associated protein 25 [Tritrichomonas foetus]|uniref:Vacuolar protein-sorting-associated protein 25 n=1 Tax=Tritrichomonas foetus TaxID=1144522 RepID=A0A1J4KXY4_9EUKA|nr:Vacuolar protein-sorting-associated protein 25 [Tritrichomonas foetus]|eukprot:OHT16042.1 Vacuolar protein-sorting-associated protein 25 [Tritrichomonas foetus]
MSYKFPPIHDFPPFYTFQENSRAALRVQLNAWTDIILHYMKAKKQSELDLDVELKTSLFNNKKIGRQMFRDHAQKILAKMVESQNATYISSGNKNKIKVIWRKPEDWAEIIVKWVNDNNFNNVIFTFYELREGDDTIDQPFHMIDYDVLAAAAKYLDSNKRGRFIQRDFPKDHPSAGKINYEECGLKVN